MNEHAEAVALCDCLQCRPRVGDGDEMLTSPFTKLTTHSVKKMLMKKIGFDRRS